MFEIIIFSREFLDDMLFCLLYAKHAIGRVPRINEDLLDIDKNYFAKGNSFWVALDENKRVVGMVGIEILESGDAWLKRLYVRPDCKRRGIGSQLLETAIYFAKSKGCKTVFTRFSRDYVEANYFYTAKNFSYYCNDGELTVLFLTL